ncbi:Ubiquilin-2 [Nosema granulosis]|uniref:Ubiquilin-2 n=1 Tax=Nosema granulosis TaxID=83296 RepID=A0A9P6GZQ1_9MICR|nr:Ubiquilin-2 [Nosema granulosis]
MKINITVRYLSNNYPLEVDSTDKLENIKKSIEDLLHIDRPLQVLTYKDRALTEDYKEVGEIGIEEGDVLYLKKRVTVNHKKKTGDIMANPMVKGFLKNPDSMKSIMEMFKDKDELKSMMNNPNIQEEIRQMSENPNYMNEQMKNFDLTVSKLENMPGGFNMINSMMRDVNDPISTALEDSLRGGSKVKEGKKIEKPITEAVPGTTRSNHLIKYRSELAFLRSMGFENPRQNLNALLECDGDLNLSVDYLKRITK